MTNHISVCFTGRRPKDLYGYGSHDAYIPLRRALETAIERFIASEGVDTFISGGAQGVDQLAFWAVENAKKRHPGIRNVVYVPFAGQERRWSQQGPFSQHEYRLMLARADGIKYVGEANADGSNIPRLLLRRNVAMLDDSQAVISVFPGASSPRVSRGGTAHCLRCALERGLPIYNIDQASLEAAFPAFA